MTEADERELAAHRIVFKALVRFLASEEYTAEGKAAELHETFWKHHPARARTLKADQPAPTETKPECSCATYHGRSCPLSPSYDVTPDYSADPRLALANPPGPRHARLIDACRSCAGTGRASASGACLACDGTGRDVVVSQPRCPECMFVAGGHFPTCPLNTPNPDGKGPHERD